MNMGVDAGMRTPPRFVPTLTEVVEVPEGLLPVDPSPHTAPTARPEPGTQDRVAPGDEVAARHPQPEQRLDAPMPASGSWPTPEGLQALGVQITEQVMLRLEQRLTVLVKQQVAQATEQWARSLSEAVNRQLQAEVPELVQQALAFAVQPVDPGAADGGHQRGFSPIAGADVDSG